MQAWLSGSVAQQTPPPPPPPPFPPPPSAQKPASAAPVPARQWISSSQGSAQQDANQALVPPRQWISTPEEEGGSSKASSAESGNSHFGKNNMMPTAMSSTMAWLAGTTDAEQPFLSPEVNANLNPSRPPTYAESVDERPIGLNRRRQDDCLTIRTLNSADTIPLGTDLDPLNGYRNLWAANQVDDLNMKSLVQCDLGRRVMDAENVGFSYAREVDKKSGYNFEGVRRAVSYFLRQGLHVVVVAKRDVEKLENEFGDAIKVISGERTDDIMVLQHAHRSNCPFVSRDGYKTWKTDPRLAQHLREWIRVAERIQVRFSWGINGEFVPDWDLLSYPGLRPSEGGGADREQCWGCQASKAGGSPGKWAWWQNEDRWFCGGCCERWSGNKGGR